MVCPNCNGPTFDGTREYVEYRCGGSLPECSKVIIRPVEDDVFPVSNCTYCKQPRKIKSMTRSSLQYCAECAAWV